jgi:hypothetical protein
MVDLDLHEKPLSRIGSMMSNHDRIKSMCVFFRSIFFVLHSESILCPFKITAANITWCYLHHLKLDLHMVYDVESDFHV